MTPSAAKQSSFDEMTLRMNNYINNNNHDGFVQQQQSKNAKHRQYLQQRTQFQFQHKPNNEPLPIKRNIIATQQPTEHTMNNIIDQGALPGAPTVAAIPEPDLHFQLSAHADFPLSPTSALQR